MNSIAFVALAFVAVGVAVKILSNWRLGFYSFLIWLLFEDLVRKYLGNNMAIYFAKDVLVGLTYIALFVDIRRGRATTFRPPFRLFLLPLPVARNSFKSLTPIPPALSTV